MPEFIYVYAVVATILVFSALWEKTSQMFQSNQRAIWLANCVAALLLMAAITGLSVLALRALSWVF